MIRLFRKYNYKEAAYILDLSSYVDSTYRRSFEISDLFTSKPFGTYFPHVSSGEHGFRIVLGIV